MLTKKEVISRIETSLTLGAVNAMLASPDDFLNKGVNQLAEALYMSLSNEGNLQVKEESNGS